MTLISKEIGSWRKKHADVDDAYNYALAACLEEDGHDDDKYYDYAPAALLEGDDDDGGYDYAPAA